VVASHGECAICGNTYRLASFVNCCNRKSEAGLIARSIDLARVRGFARQNYSSRVLANFISALTFGRLIVAFDNDLPADELEQWTDASMVLLGALFFAD